jgi:hypothetical protein
MDPSSTPAPPHCPRLGPVWASLQTRSGVPRRSAATTSPRSQPPLPPPAHPAREPRRWGPPRLSPRLRRALAHQARRQGPPQPRRLRRPLRHTSTPPSEAIVFLHSASALMKMDPPRRCPQPTKRTCLPPRPPPGQRQGAHLRRHRTETRRRRLPHPIAMRPPAPRRPARCGAVRRTTVIHTYLLYHRAQQLHAGVAKRGATSQPRATEVRCRREHQQQSVRCAGCPAPGRRHGLPAALRFPRRAPGHLQRPCRQ